MDFDDLDEAQGLSEEVAALEPELQGHIADTGAPPELADFLIERSLLSCLDFFAFIQADREEEIKTEIEKRVALQLRPPCDVLKEQVKIRNVWRRCKVSAGWDLEKLEERKRLEAEREAEQRAAAERAERTERERQQTEKREREAAERAERLRLQRAEAEERKAERAEKAEQERREREAAEAEARREQEAAEDAERLRRRAEREEQERRAREEEERLEKRRLEEIEERRRLTIQRLVERCEREVRRELPPWSYVSIEQVQANHSRTAPGMLYGMVFPWSAEMLLEFGATWLTDAFHRAGTMLKENRVTGLKLNNEMEVTTGNNGGKFLFSVAYLQPEEGLHTKLFAKVPYPMSNKTSSDRLSSSVYKQPQELYELNSYRLLEATMPVVMPKFYFGDISNETTNWILITSQVEFDDPEPVDFGPPKELHRTPLDPYKIEGPYDKCIDWTLRGSASEYYYKLVYVGAKMAGMHKAGQMGDPVPLMKNFEDYSARPVESWGMRPEASGEPPKQFKIKLNTAETFIFDAGKVLFPAYVQTDTFRAKWRTTLMTLNAYSAESMFWRHRNIDYVSLTHNNLNVDNAYWWRDEAGTLDCGVFDWGNMGSRSLGFKLWWWLYCGDHDVLASNLDGYLQCFVDTYREFGGPAIEKSELRNQFIITALEQMQGLSNAVPQIFRMCPRKEWSSIADRYDPRIAQNIHGKSTLRLYLHVMDSILRIMEEWKGAEVLQDFVRDFVKEVPVLEKSATTIWGEEPPKNLLWAGAGVASS